ncbi:hypothetical protein F2P56_007583 [Juglans regia]|uniref:RNase H type-1 domain-containing protein n=2 Tax=Juglans regia TaxID=51240 RepID=A0A833XRM5_JUGRE|nr:uncharacterized protein LOC108990899 [Juglans regia]KAF5475817.1 hypothetical protein F2P56_007583 [Juglans regia]
MKNSKTSKDVQPGLLKPTNLRWQPPPLNTYKINWEAAVDRTQSKIAVCIIVKNWTGKVLATSRLSRPLFLDPLLAEAFGALEATCFGLKMGLDNEILEETLNKLLRTSQRRGEHWSGTSMVVEDIKIQLKQFVKWSANHVRRDVNKVAHVLARNALLIPHTVVHTGNVPSCIQDLI